MSSSQLTFAREEAALDLMPSTPGKAACEGDTRFDVFAERNRIDRDTRNQLARTCAKCPLRDCGWRQAYVPTAYEKRLEDAR